MLPIEKKALQNKKFIVLYGAGYHGEIAYKILEREGMDITCYVVSDGQAVATSLNGKAVKYLSDIEYTPENTVFILTLNQKYWNEIQEKLNIKGYQCILPFAFQKVVEYLESYFLSVMAEKKISIENKTVNFGILTINNPLATKLKDMFLFEMIDLILPYLGEDIFILEGSYEIENIAVESNDVVIDCGANIGVFSAFAAQKGGEVYAFEPVPETQEYLQENAALYPGKIHVEPYALSDEIGENVFFITDDGSWNTLLEGFGNKIDQIKVPTITLDQFVIERGLEQVDFIKADIEGAERLMLAGAQETLRRFAPKLAICTYHLPDDKEVLENLIKQANPDYIITHRWKKLYAYVPTEKRQ